MEYNHTPGPWFISPNQNYIRAIGVHGWNIATIEDQPPYTEANAKLIKSAPDLLEALKELLECDYTSGTHLYAAQMKGKAAIEKATGATYNLWFEKPQKEPK